MLSLNENKIKILKNKRNKYKGLTFPKYNIKFLYFFPVKVYNSFIMGNMDRTSFVRTIRVVPHPPH